MMQIKVAFPVPDDSMPRSANYAPVLGRLKMTLLNDAGIDAIVSPFTLEDIPWEGGQRLYGWWCDARGDRLFPSRADFHPVAMTPFLNTMVLHDVEPVAAPAYRFRLVGTEFYRWLGRDPTGQPLSDIPNTEPLRARYDWLRANKRPYLCRELPLEWSGKGFLSYSTLVLPLGDSDDRVDTLIANVHFQAD